VIAAADGGQIAGGPCEGLISVCERQRLAVRQGLRAVHQGHGQCGTMSKQALNTDYAKKKVKPQITRKEIFFHFHREFRSSAAEWVLVPIHEKIDCLLIPFASWPFSSGQFKSLFDKGKSWVAGTRTAMTQDRRWASPFAINKILSQ
jgi:hypothetical protein